MKSVMIILYSIHWTSVFQVKCYGTQECHECFIRVLSVDVRNKKLISDFCVTQSDFIVSSLVHSY